MSGFLRTLPLFTPRVQNTTMGRPVSRSVFASRPRLASYFSTWSRTHCCELGWYSPSNGMPAVCPAFGSGQTQVALHLIEVQGHRARDLQSVSQANCSIAAGTRPVAQYC